MKQTDFYRVPVIFILVFVVFSNILYGDTYWQPYNYHENFNEGELNAWASYPPNQDTAYDPYTYPGTMLPGERNICLVTSCDPPWNAAQRLGAVKRLSCVLGQTAEISFRYYIKSVSKHPELTVHVPLITGERIICRVPNPGTNSWQTITLRWKQLADAFPEIDTVHRIEMSALAIQLKVPDADTDMPVFFGLDDITVTAVKEPSFHFNAPETALLPEFEDQVSLNHYIPGDLLKIEGWFDSQPLSAEFRVTPFINREQQLVSVDMHCSDGVWRTEDSVLEESVFSAGLYRAVISADYNESGHVETSFAFIVENKRNAEMHPRLVIDSERIESVKTRIKSEKFEPVRNAFKTEAERLRKELDPAALLYDTDQFPDEDWLATLGAWSGGRIRISREALFFNAFAYSLLDDRDAGEYCREIMLRLASWPQWNHPWMEKRGFHTYYPLGEFALDYALAYDFCYDLLKENERVAIRNALYDNFIEPAYRTYVVDDQVTTNSSNWISHIMGGALFALAAVDGELSAGRPVEPLLTGSLMKMQRYISTAFGRDGSYGEGFRYFNFAMQSFAWTLPAIERTYGVDFSGPLKTAHLETLWASNLERNYAFTFGDSEPFLKRESTAKWIAAQNGPMNSWTWLIDRTEDPVLAWLYHELKEYDTIHEVLHDVEHIPTAKPDSLGTVRFFRDVGTAVFKSGWGADDFTFVFRCGPFYNHQHLDQGTFFLADHGEIFIEERHDGEHHYYDDPVYRSHAIQPIAHNTVLVDENPQSQKTGDPKDFADGMNDQAGLVQWIDSENFAFVSGDLAGLYPDGPEILRRSVLYIKPRIILLIDEASSTENHTINLLFHTKWKKDISITDDRVLFKKNGPVLHLFPLTPAGAEKDILSEPHFLAQFNERPLIERGYLRLSADTQHDKSLVMANLMTAAAEGAPPAVDVQRDHDSVRVHCQAGQENALVSLRTEDRENVLDKWSSDALVLAVHEHDDRIFMVDAAHLRQNGRVIFQADGFITGVLNKNNHFCKLNYFSKINTNITIIVDKKPEVIERNGMPDKESSYDSRSGAVKTILEKGEGNISITY